MRAIKCDTNDQGCWLVVSHKLNPDGYFRKGVKGYLFMFHRLIFSHFNGEIPEGYDIDHMCKNRSCCNPKHLQLFKHGPHQADNNKNRYKHIIDAARKYWIANPDITGTELGQFLGRTHSTGCRWIKQFKKELITN